MELGLKNGQMVPNMLGIGQMTKQMVMGNYIMQIKMCMKESGLMIKLTGKAYILMPMEQGTMENGRMINNMV